MSECTRCQELEDQLAKLREWVKGSREYNQRAILQGAKWGADNRKLREERATLEADYPQLERSPLPQEDVERIVGEAQKRLQEDEEWEAAWHALTGE